MGWGHKGVLTPCASDPLCSAEAEALIVCRARATAWWTWRVLFHCRLAVAVLPGTV